MTAQERDTLNLLEYNLKRLMDLVATQSQVLQRQHQSLRLLREENALLRQDLERERQHSHLREVAQGFLEHEGRAQSLGYLAEIIEDVKLSIRQLEQE